jgi:hypothetical protein
VREREKERVSARERERKKKERGNAFLKRTDLKVEKNEDERFKKKNKPDSYQMII